MSSRSELPLFLSAAPSALAAQKGALRALKWCLRRQAGAAGGPTALIRNWRPGDAGGGDAEDRLREAGVAVTLQMEEARRAKKGLDVWRPRTVKMLADERLLVLNSSGLRVYKDR